MFTTMTREGERHSTHAKLKDAIDQADLIRGCVDFEGVRITAGEGTDSDTGYVGSIVDGTTALVQWDQGIVTPCDVSDITAIS